MELKDKLIQEKVEQEKYLVIKNRTRDFLLPPLKSLGATFIKELNKYYSVAVGIADMDQYPYIEEPSILLLKNVKESNVNNFQDSLKKLRRNPHFKRDYLFADVYESYLHMFVISLPKELHSSYEKFLEGKYSEMYTNAQKQAFFVPKKGTKSYYRRVRSRQILDKSDERRQMLADKLNAFIPNDVELDSKIDLRYEVFNYCETKTPIGESQTKISYEKLL